MFNIFAGVKDKRFIKNALPLLIIGLLSYYLFVALIGEQINILATVMTGETGWDMGVVMNAYTIGGLLSVPATFLINTLLMKVSTRKFLVINSFIIAVAVALMGISVQFFSMFLFMAAFLIVRVFAVCIQSAVNYMCTEWWVKNKGKALGIITMGAPIASATFVALMTFLTGTSLMFTGSYFIFAGMMVVLGILSLIWYKDRPEDIGLYPDGASEAPVNEDQPENKLRIRDVLKNPRTWMLIVSFGIINFCNNSMTAFFVPAMQAKGVDTGVYLSVLAIGAVVGIPISFLLGVIDDKWGTPKASVCLCGLAVIGFLGMAFTQGNMYFTIGLATFGYASITGGFPNLLPSMVAYTFGRRNFLGASRIIFALIAVIASFASQYMGAFLQMDMLTAGYFGLIAAVVVSALLILFIGRKPAYDSLPARMAPDKA